MNTFVTGIKKAVGLGRDKLSIFYPYHGTMVPNVTKFGDMKGFSFYPILVSPLYPILVS